MRNTLVAGLFVIGIVGSAAATAGTATGEETAADDGVREHVLENGLRLFTKEAFGKDLIAVNLFVDGGNRTESADLSGLSHYYEHLIFRGGTAEQQELETRKAFNAIGDFSGYTSSDLTCYNFVVPSGFFDEGLRRFADACLNVDVTADKVAKEREVIMSEYKMRIADSPSGWAWYLMIQKAFRVHPYGRTTIGQREVLETAPLDRFKTFYAERYVPNHMVLSVVGAIKHDEARAKIEASAFGKKPRGARATFETGEAEPAQTAYREAQDEKDSELSYLSLGFRSIGALHADAPAITVLAQVLGAGESSRLERNIRGKGLALAAAAWFDQTKDPNLAGVGLDVDPGKEVQALEATIAEVARLKVEPVTPEELARAKEKIEKEWVFGEETYLDQASRMGWFAVMGDASARLRYLAGIRAVTAADLTIVANRYFTSKTATLSVVRPKGKPRIDGLGPIVARIDDAAPPAAAGGADGGTSPSPGVGPDKAIKVPPEALEAVAAAARKHAPSLVRKLPNGVLAIAREDRSSPIVAVSVKTREMLTPETYLQPGTAALLDRLRLRGAGSRTREQFGAEVDRLGLRLATGFDREYGEATLSSTADTFEAGLDLLADALLRPALDPKELEIAREEQLAAIQSVQDDGYALAAQELYALLYGDWTPGGRPLVGTEAGVKAATREDLAALNADLMRGERLVVAVCGAIAPEAAIAAVEKRFGALEREAPAKEPLATPPALEPGDRLIQKPREQITFRLGHVGVPATAPDWVPLQLAVRYLGTTLFFKYVYEEGMAYRMWTYLRGGRTAQPFTFEMGVSAPNYQRAREGLETALKAFQKEGLTERELGLAKAEYVQRFLLGQQTNLGQAATLTAYEVLGLGHDFGDRLPDLVLKATRDEVMAAAQTHLDPRKLRIAVVGDLAKAGASVSPSGPPPGAER